MKTILTIIGTRPEVIKMAPVIIELRRSPKEFNAIICVTGQHREMVDQILDVFDLKPDLDLNVMTPNQSLASLTAALFEGVDAAVRQSSPDWVLAQGDTTSVFVSSMVAYYNKVHFGHVEAGLRTGDRFRPFPEELNRIVVDQIADLLFAPTLTNKSNLLREGVAPERILVTGNTVVDALQAATEIPYDWMSGPLNKVPRGRRLVLVTAHRRESFGRPLRQMLKAIHDLAERFATDDISFVFPVHRNPNIRIPTEEALGSIDNIILLEPLDYLSLINLMRASELVLTDSGGIQEEAPSLGVPVLVMRERTERMEGVAAGFIELVGTDRDRIVVEATRILSRRQGERKIRKNPYGDGKAAHRIVDALRMNRVQYDGKHENIICSS